MENLNISEVLFYAPKGLMLYSPIFGEVEFIEIDEDNCIVVRDKHDNLRWFYEYGTYFPSDESNYAEGECLLFPSIDNRCWDNWQNILFPKSIGSVCFDTITGNKFILDHNGTFFSDGTGSLFLTLVGNSGNYLLNSVYASPSQTKEFFEELEKTDYEWVSDTVVRKKQNRPKFKVGDWVVNNNSGDVFQVTEIKDDEYCLWPLYGEICGYLRIIDVDTDYHLWTIDDAKDGDVLVASDSSLFIFAKVKDNSAYYYFSLCKNGSKEISDGNRAWETANSCHPATKEQRDLLFKKIEEAGYQWDDDKKELKKRDTLQPKFKVGDWIVNNEDGSIGQITDIIYDELGYGYNHTNGWLHFVFENDFHLWTIQDAKDGDVLVTPPIKGSENNVQIFIFKGINNRDYVDNCIEYYCRVCNGVFYENKTGFMGTTSSTFYPATKGQRDFLFQKMKEEGYKWDVDAKKLIKTTTPIPKFKFTTPIPKFKFGDIIKHKNAGAINSIKYVCSGYYVLDNNQVLFFESQDMWELVVSKVKPTIEEKVNILADEILALKERVKALEIQAIRQCSDKNRLDALESKMIILDSHNINNRLDALESRVNALGLQAIRTTPLLTSASDGMAEDNVALDEENESK